MTMINEGEAVLRLASLAAPSASLTQSPTNYRWWLFTLSPFGANVIKLSDKYMIFIKLRHKKYDHKRC